MKLNRGYGLDRNGFIVSDVSKEKINSIYVPCIQECVQSLQKLFLKQLHSVYLYGSVARGEAKINTSDLDLIAMFHTKISSTKLAALKTLARDLSSKYNSLFRDVGIAVAYYDETMEPANYYENAFLTELCICIHGENIGSQFGPYKLSPDIAISFNGDIDNVMHRILRKLETETTSEFQSLTQSFARKLIRTYYSMVMARSQIWTTRIHEQTEVFVYYFPEKTPVLTLLLKWIEEPPTDYKKVYALFKTEGEWASKHFLEEAKVVSKE